MSQALKTYSKGRPFIMCGLPLMRSASYSGLVSAHFRALGEPAVDSADLVLALFDEAYERRTWHVQNLKQSLRGVTAKQAAWRPGRGGHNIWEITLHVAYWKYTLRRRIEGGKRGSFALEGSNFFARPEPGANTEAAWSADKELGHPDARALRERMQ